PRTVLGVVRLESGRLGVNRQRLGVGVDEPLELVKVLRSLRDADSRRVLADTLTDLYHLDLLQVVYVEPHDVSLGEMPSTAVCESDDVLIEVRVELALFLMDKPIKGFDQQNRVHRFLLL